MNKADTPTDEEYADGLEALQSMMGEWSLHKYLLSLPYSAITQTVNHPKEYHTALKYSLAIEIAEEYGVALPASVIGKESRAKKALRNFNAQPVDQLETKIFNETLLNSKYTYDINTDEGY